MIWLVAYGLTQPIAVAIALGIPPGWVLMNRWLDGFAHRINISWPMLLTSGVFTLVLAWSVVSLLTYRAANANPVENLRDE